jgi:hypothetical protein
LLTVSPVSHGNQNEEERLLAKLPYAASATFNHYRWQGESQCLAGTRTHLLDAIMAWARSAAAATPIDGGRDGNSGSSSGGGGQRIFWLDGMAGTGKSTIARSIARRCSSEGLLGASFFFSRGGGELETARKFVTTIAVQLARRHRQLQAGICDAVREHPDIAEKLLGDQWQRLVLGPCQRLRAAGTLPLPLPPLVVVIDALDECKAAAEVEFVLELICETSGLAAAQLLVFMTSRPEITVRAKLDAMAESQRRCVILHHVEQAIVGRDIRMFFEHSLSVVFRNRPFLARYSDEEVVDRLVERADGLFIWAATACRFFRDGGPQARRRLDVIVQHQGLVGPGNPEQKLDEIYTSVLRNALRRTFAAVEQERFCRSVNDVLGTIAVLSSSFSAPCLAALLFLSEIEVLDVLCDLHSMIDVPVDRSMPIRPHHASVRDFLLNKKRCTDTRFWVDEQKAHARVARRCLQLMTTCLKKDICGLREPGVLRNDVSKELVDAHISPSLRYACLHWVEHVKQSDNPQLFQNPVNSFFRERFPHCLEVLALSDKLSEGLEMLALLSRLYVSSILQIASACEAAPLTRF